MVRRWVSLSVWDKLGIMENPGESVVTTFFLNSETGEEYALVTSSEDAKRITTDITFATLMFAQAKKDHEAASRVAQAKINRDAAFVQAKEDEVASRVAQAKINHNPAFAPAKRATHPTSTRNLNDILEENSQLIEDGDYFDLNRSRMSSPMPQPSDDSGSEILEAAVSVDTQSDDPDNPNVSTVNPQHEDTCHWTTPMCLLLLTSYQAHEKNFSSGKMSQTQAWDIISQQMQLKNYKVSGSKCQSKLASLKKTYKKTKDHNKKSGNQRKSWKYLARMDEIFGTKPWVNPVATASSTSTFDSDTNKAADESCTKKRKPNTANYLKDLVEEKKKSRELKETQHQQKLEEVRKMNTLLEKILQQNK